MCERRLKVTNYFRSTKRRYSHEIYWKDFYWSMALGCARKLVLGLHVRGTFDRLQQLPIKEVTLSLTRSHSATLDCVYYVDNTSSPSNESQ